MVSEKRTRLERFFAMDSSNAPLALDLLRLCIEEGDHVRAREIAAMAGAGSQWEPMQLNELGLLLGRLGEWDSAIHRLQEAITVDPSHALRFNLGFAQLAAGFHDEACGTFAAALEAYPGSAEYRYFFGLAEYAAGNFSESKAAVELVLENEPNHQEAMVLLGTLAVESGDTVEAERQAERVLKLNEGSFDALWLKAQSAVLAFDFDKALESLQKAQRLRPDDLQVQLLIGQMLLGLQRVAEAKRTFSAVASQRLNVSIAAAATVNLGWCAVLDEDYSDALALFSRAVELHPTLADGYAGLALASAALGHQEQVHGYAQRALDLSPNHPLALSLRASHGTQLEQLRDQQKLLSILGNFPATPHHQINMLTKLTKSPLGKIISQSLLKKYN